MGRELNIPADLRQVLTPKQREQERSLPLRAPPLDPGPGESGAV